MSDTCPAEVHDTCNAYRRYGCRCPAARGANAARLARWRKRTYLERGGLLVDPTGTRRRIEALRAIGWPIRVIAAEAGVSHGTLHYTMGRSERIHLDTARRFADVYDRLSMRLPGRVDPRVVKRAQEMGWAPPLAWDDDTIDDPKARPRVGPRVQRYRHVDEIAVDEAVAGRSVRLTVHERREAVLRMRELGLSSREIGERLGMTTEAARRLVSRTNRRAAGVAA
jgi:hypothetical protein